ncbi:MAG: trypsin-like peptidase domain-containing protein [Gaiellaceae bacterium MAG52_C11]|nr:trypsin-like peptidase domain-containing protein [Candidatus Gaiellasilicea maunaloa]
MLLTALIVGGCSGDDDSPTAGSTTSARPATTTTTRPSGEAPPASADGSIADAVADVLPSVVNVRTIVPGGGSGEGSGVVVDRNGIIVTNNHVVDGASEIAVAFNDGRHTRPLRGTVIGTAPERDLAVLRVAARDLVPIRIARSSSLRLGDDVIAVGFPLGLGGPTVTSGIVSGLNRTIEPGDGARLEGLLQTDAAINPGNSGGALVDRAGRLVGINTAAARAGAAENIGFAIEIDAALPIIEEIRSEPEATRAWLGISIASVESDSAAVALGLDPATRGVRITEVYDGGPAARAEVLPGDVIVALDGRPIGSARELTAAVARLDPGDSIELELIDTAGPRLVELTVTRRPR